MTAPTTNAAVYRFAVGDIRATAVSDGQAEFPAHPHYAPNATAEQVRDTLARRGADPELHLLNATALLLEHHGRTVLVDAGAGTALGPGFGALPDRLRQIGTAPEDVDVVHITHGHLDHIGGLVAPDGEPVFPRARLSIHAADWAYWTDPALDLDALPLPQEFRDAFRDTAHRTLPRFAERVDLFTGPVELVPGVTAEPAVGHTPGHSIVVVRDRGRELVVVGDVFHHEAFDLEHPDWLTAFDWDPRAVPAVRRALLDRLVRTRAQVLAYHAPFPGLGHVLPDGDAYRWQPTGWRLG